MFKKIIGIASCKGGVGKSTISVNLAISLSNFYKKNIGLLDADIYGPSHPKLLGISETKNIQANVFIPEKKFGILSMSIGYFIKNDSSVMLRGPMISNTLNHLIKNTEWGDIDILVIDFPPGTGDIYLTLLRDLKINGILLVTIPQIISNIDVKKSIIMLNKFNINIYGLIENMKYYTCKYCNKKNNMHDENDMSTTDLIKEFNIKNFYNLNFDSEISKSCSNGTPFVIYDNSEATKIIKKISLDIINNMH